MTVSVEYSPVMKSQTEMEPHSNIHIILIIIASSSSSSSIKKAQILCRCSCTSPMVTSVSVSPLHMSLVAVVVSTCLGSSIGHCRWTDVVVPSGEDLTHAGSATEQLLSLVEGLVGGVLWLLDQSRRY